MSVSNEITIKGQYLLEIRNMLFATIVWGAFVFPMTWYFILPTFLSGDYLVGLFFLFPLLGIFFLYFLLQGIYRYLKFGRSCFVMDNDPIYPGGEVTGVFHGYRSLPIGSNIKLTLKCEFQSVKEDQQYGAWNETVRTEAANMLSKEQQSVPVAFTLPEGESGVEWDRYIKYGDWLLSVDLEGAPTHPITFCLPLVSR